MSTWRGYDHYLLNRAQRATSGARHYLDEDTVRSRFHDSYGGATLYRNLDPGSPDVFDIVESSKHPTEGRVYRVTRLTFTPEGNGERLDIAAMTEWLPSAGRARTAYRNR